MAVRTGLLAAGAALALFAAGAPAAFADWVMVGQREVAERAETDTIELEGHRRYDRLRICVYRNPVHFIDVDVHFENGGHQDVPLAARINARGCTRVIDLEGGQRDIDRIVLRYEETSRRAARALVRVFAE